MCLTGVDYFSTLGYQPGIAALAAGVLSPMATVVLVLVTLFGALPVYRRVAVESPHGEGSIAMLERLLSFWKGKLFVLVLLGFAATDFLITMTLSAADATAHIDENPFWPSAFHGHEVLITLVLLALLGAVFLKGFTEAIGIAVGLVAVYLALNVVVIADGMWHVITEPVVVTHWTDALTAPHGNPFMVIAVALLVFPKLALGLSGFETGVAVMPHIEGDPDDTEQQPTGRIRGARRLLTTAAVIMSVFLIFSSIVTTLLIPEREFQPGGAANGRALAHLAHTVPGQRVRHRLRRLHHRDPVVRRRVRDGRPAEPRAALPAPVRHGAGLGARRPPAGAGAHRHRVPGDDPVRRRRRRPGRRVRDRRPRADHLGRGRCDAVRPPRPASAARTWGFAVIAAVFVYMTIANVIERPDGVKIGACFIAGIIGVSAVSRVRRAFDLRVTDVELDHKAQLFVRDSVRSNVRLVANEPDQRDAHEYREKLRQTMHDNDLPTPGDVLFVEVTVTDPSEFETELQVRGEVRADQFRVLTMQSSAVPPALAALALDVRDRTGHRPHLYFEWTEGNPVRHFLRYLVLGQGEVAPVTREILRQAEPDPDRRPHVHVG